MSMIDVSRIGSISIRTIDPEMSVYNFATHRPHLKYYISPILLFHTLDKAGNGLRS